MKPPTTALVVRDGATRTRLAGYLSEAGIVVSEYEHAPPMATSLATAVWVIPVDEEGALALVGSWLGAGTQRRAILITRTPRTARSALATDEDRLEILIPPVFPWQLVDAVRANGSGPR